MSNDKEWISVKDRLPEKNQVTLIYDSTVSCIVGGIELNRPRIGYFKGDAGRGNEWLTETFNLDPDITHWMPLPEPPKE